MSRVLGFDDFRFWESQFGSYVESFFEMAGFEGCVFEEGFEGCDVLVGYEGYDELAGSVGCVSEGGF